MYFSPKLLVRSFFVILTFLIFAELRAIHQSRSAQPTMDLLLEYPESIIYTVHYGFLTLGNVILDPVRDTLYNGKNAHYYRTIIRSNPSIPFVGRKERHFHSIFSYNDDIAYGLNFWTDNIDSEEYLDTRYLYNYDTQEVIYFEFEEPVDTLLLDSPGDSGPVLYFVTRLFAGMDDKVDYPIYISGEKGNVEMTFTTKTDRMSSPAFENGSTEAFYSYGDAKLKGPFGFSGNFKAWHNTDERRIPVEAHVRVWVGNVKVRLLSYEKQ